MAEFIIKRQNGESVLKFPEKCPICHRLVVITGHHTHRVHASSQLIQVVFVCPNPDCNHIFMGHYKILDSRNTEIIRYLPCEPQPHDVPDIAQRISPSFVSIYKEAMEAQINGLKQICGPGFRKAFEFLIKDYAKQKVDLPEERTRIENAFAGQVVNIYIEDVRIQAVSKRALWIGNDESHYLRKWETRNIDDLLKLIKLTLRWMEIEHESLEYVEEMPEKGKETNEQHAQE